MIFSDTALLDEMVAELNNNEGRVSTAVQEIVGSSQFRMIRGSDYSERLLQWRLLRFAHSFAEIVMPSPFPGMDPFIEQQEWEDFHQRFNNALADLLAPKVEPQYIARVEKRVYVESPPEHGLPPRWADVAVMRFNDSGGGVAMATATDLDTATEECELPMSVERRETYLVIRERATHEVITIIETLSPANKRNGEGHHEYQKKRETILRSLTHLVELDLLRGGMRMPTKNRKPPADYYAIISHADRRPRATLTHWTIRDRLPTLMIPLKRPDPDVPLDLQAALTTVYDRARYQLSLDYHAELSPPLTDEQDRAWVSELIKPLGHDPGG